MKYIRIIVNWILFLLTPVWILPLVIKEIIEDKGKNDPWPMLTKGEKWLWD